MNPAPATAAAQEAPPAGAFTGGALLTSIGPADIAAALRQCGYRATVVEHAQFPQVQSAVQGLGFFVAFGAPQAVELAPPPARYIDFSFHCRLGVRGELPPAAVEGWNQTKRFGRLTQQGHTLALSLDVLIGGGVSPQHLRAQCELWDRLVRDLILHLQRLRPPQKPVNDAGAAGEP